MHTGGASGAFGGAAPAATSIFARPENWTPPATSSTTNFFKPVVVPTSTSQSGNPDWAKNLASRTGSRQMAGDSDEEEPEEPEEEEEEEEEAPYGDDDYEGEQDYEAQARDLSDLEEADEESYEVVDE